MPRRKPDDAVKQRMWAAVLKAANHHHDYPSRGIQTLISTDAGVSKAAVSDWKHLGNYPEEKTLRRLADTYGVSAEILSGYVEGDVLAEGFGPPDKMLTRSVNLTEQIASRMIKNPGMSDLLRVQRRVNELMLEGRSENQGHDTN